MGFTSDEVSSLTLLPPPSWRLHQPSNSVAVPGVAASVRWAQARTAPRVLRSSTRSPSAMPSGAAVSGLSSTGALPPVISLSQATLA